MSCRSEFAQSPGDVAKIHTNNCISHLSCEHFPNQHKQFRVRAEPLFRSGNESQEIKPPLRASSLSGVSGLAPMWLMASAAARLPSWPQAASGSERVSP